MEASCIDGTQLAECLATYLSQRRALIRRAKRFVYDRDAEDCVQEAAVIVWRRRAAGLRASWHYALRSGANIVRTGRLVAMDEAERLSTPAIDVGTAMMANRARRLLQPEDIDTALAGARTPALRRAKRLLYGNQRIARHSAASGVAAMGNAG